MAAPAIGGTINAEIGSRLTEKVKIKSDAPSANAKNPMQARSSTPRPSPSHKPTLSAGHTPNRPLTAHEKQTMAEAEQAAHLKLPKAGLDINKTKKEFIDINGRLANARETKIHDATDQTLGMLSELTHGTLAGNIVDSVRSMRQDGRTLLYGNNTERMHAALDVGVVVGASLIPEVGVLVAPRIAATASRLGLFGRGSVRAENLAIRQRVLGNIAESKAARSASNFEIHALIEEVPSLNISTRMDEAVFWSGRGNKELAESYASGTNKFTLEMTPGGQYLDSRNLSWERLSARFAQDASGRVSALADTSRPTSVFNRIEYPILRDNPNVTEIIFSPDIQYQNAYRPH